MVTRDDPGIDELVLSARLLRTYLAKTWIILSVMKTVEFVHQVMKYAKDWIASLLHFPKHIMKYVRSKQSVVKNFLASVTSIGIIDF